MKSVAFPHFPKTGGLSIIKMIQVEAYESHIKVNNFELDLLLGAVREPPVATYGHFSLGLLPYLPPDSFVFTFLRHPAKRLVSLFNYIHGLADVGYQHYLNIGFRPDMSFEEFVAVKPFANLSDGMVRQLCGIDFLFEVDYRPLEESNYRQALNILGQFDFIGLLETFQSDVRDLAELVGWQLPNGIAHINSSQPHKVGAITNDIISLVEAHNSYDTRLYLETKRK